MHELKYRLRDVYQELQGHFLGRNKLLDTIIPPLVFMITHARLDLQTALWASLAVGLMITVFRLLKRQTLIFASGGFLGVLLAVLFAWGLASAESYFLPNIITNGIFMLVAFVSLFLRRPLMAWASYFTHKWPLSWYWHPRVNPAYMEVTFGWSLFLTLRFVTQVFLFQHQLVNALGVFQILTGSPMTLFLLVVSYLYGIRRLQALRGPSVVEFNLEKPQPWHGQRRSF